MKRYCDQVGLIRKIQVALPDVSGREAMPKFIVKTKLDNEVNIRNIAKQTTGFTGADLENFMNKSVLLNLLGIHYTIQ